jgi:hypothetical protein
MQKFGVQYNPADSRLLIDASTASLKAVVLHNGNDLPSVPIAYSFDKETYDVIKLMIENIRYSENEWFVCCDLKMVAILLGMQGGNTKFSCFLCLWDSRAYDKHWKTLSWPDREEMNIGERNVIREPLVKRENIIFPPLHIKLGLMSQFLKSVDQESEWIRFFLKFFPKQSLAKTVAGIFNGPQIRKLMKSDEFPAHLTKKQAKAWESFKRDTKFPWKSSQWRLCRVG